MRNLLADYGENGVFEVTSRRDDFVDVGYNFSQMGEHEPIAQMAHPVNNVTRV
mgnify:CR=1 FL=1